MATKTHTLGDYNIIKKIGQGSLGTVYLAEHRFMHKPYAIKVLPEELAEDRAFINRFQEEIASLSSLEHPNIVKVHNISNANGRYFLVTDCIVDSIGETTNLSQYLATQDSSLNEKELFKMLYQIAEALDYTHSKMLNGKRMAHRNLKLNNILVSHDDNGDIHLYLSDLGLSRVVGTGAVLSRTFKAVAEALEINPIDFNAKTQSDSYPSPPPNTKKLTRLHTSFLQSFAFLAPEQKLTSYNEEQAYKSDIYAFGILTYYLISGKYPEGCFDMPSTTDSEYNHDWDAVVTACLQQDPHKRPEYLTEILNSSKKQKTLVKPATSPYTTHSSSEKANIQAPTPIEAATPLQQSSSILSTEDNHEAISPAQSPAKPLLKPLIEEGEISRPHYDPDPAASLVVDPSVKVYHPQPKAIKDVTPIETEMIVVEGGNFQRGCNDGNRDEMPLHHVDLASFAIEVHPVTNEQFTRFLEAMDGLKDGNNQDIIRLRESRIKNIAGRLDIESGYAKHPVVGVTWYGAVAYAKWVGKRLPTEAEWEVAARGSGIENIYPTGSDIEKYQANYFSADTTPVMSYQANSIGLHDIAGNVYEWCQDWYGYNYYETASQEPNNPRGPIQGVYRVLRGGCWKSLKEDLRITHRNRNNPGTFNRTYGFRCAANVEQIKKTT
ncbi:MAG: SUMF1/EgtB/PvdO family nonheme iron enzyme [Chlamydiales bacterium]|nr:SUMF1/EgtB/PvdO family nonheme iron enzyme [Chlamydiales bacterium]